MNRAAHPVRIYWLDYAGKRQSYGSLQPGQSQNQQTYAKQSWIVADAQGKCLAIYVAGPEPAKAIFAGA